jgi:hypothetical protein
MSTYSRSNVLVMVLGCVMLSALPAVGGPQGESAAAKQDPVELLMKLDGTWEVDPGDGKKATCEGKKIAGGKGIYTLFKRPLKTGTYEAHAIWSFDPETGKVIVYELNSYGDVFEHVGNFKKDGRLHLVRKSRTGKRVTVQKTVMTWKSPDEIVSKIDEKQKGKWETFSFTFKRVNK